MTYDPRRREQRRDAGFAFLYLVIAAFIGLGLGFVILRYVGG